MPQFSSWPSILATLEKEHPFLRNLRVAPLSMALLPSSRMSGLPSHLKIAIAAVSRLESHKRLTMISPRRAEDALWVAAGTALMAMKNDSVTGLGEHTFSIGQKVLLDGDKVLIYEGLTDYQGLTKIQLRDSGGILKVPLHVQKRLQPTTAKRLSRVPWAGSARPDLLDHLLGIDTQGARHQFGSRVVLVSTINSASDFARSTITALYRSDSQNEINDIPLSSVPANQSLHSLFQWGKLGTSGRVESVSAGQIEAQPVLILCSDLIALRSFLREKMVEGKKLPTVILDGSRTFKNHHGVLEEIGDMGTPIFSLLERGEDEYVADLHNSGFSIWRWSKDDLHALHHKSSSQTISPLFRDTQDAINNFINYELDEIVCSYPALDQAASTLIDVLELLPDEGNEILDLESTMWRALLCVARLPYCEAPSRSLLDIQSIEQKIVACGLMLKPEIRARIRTFCKELAEVLADDYFAVHDIGEDNRPVPRYATLRHLLNRTPQEKFLVVLSDAGDASKAANYFSSLKNVDFCAPSTLNAILNSRSGDSSYDHVVICGWLGSTRMRRLIDGCIAANIIVLLYEFEREWLRKSLHRWRGRNGHGNQGGAIDLKLIGHGFEWSTSTKNSRKNADAGYFDREELPSLQSSRHRESSYTGRELQPYFDVESFEARMLASRRSELLDGNRNGEETEATRMVEFVDGYYAFLSEKRTIPVLTSLIGSNPDKSKANKKIPERRITELMPGDYTVMHIGEKGDIIRGIADQILKRSGRAHLREVAGIWLQALRSYVDLRKELAAGEGKILRTRDVIRELQKAGINREEATIRNWIDEDDRIGPGEMGDLDHIATITRNERLMQQLPHVKNAITSVRGAHLSAATDLANNLLDRLPAYLSRNRSESSDLPGSIELEITGVGRVIVLRIEEIANETTHIARSKTGVLAREE